MGFTRFWYRKEKEVSQEKFDCLVADVKAIIAKSGVIICGPQGEGEPIVTPDLISFNGDGDNAHETFFFPRKITDEMLEDYREYPKDGGIFFFCKTACKPYDKVVAACLVAVKRWFEDTKITADGGDDADWFEGMGLYTAATGNQARVPVDHKKR